MKKEHKKVREAGRVDADEILPEYDFSRARPNKYASRSGRLAAAFSISIACLLPLSPQTAPPHALTLPLKCASGDCSLLHGAPQTAGMRSGFVRLKPGDSVGWHTTGQNEESLVILHGQGEALIEGEPGRSFTAPGFVYVPPATRHNVKNTGGEVLEYVYVVAPAGRP